MKATTLIGIIPHYKNLFFSRLKPKKGQKKTEIYFSNQNFKQNNEFKKKKFKKKQKKSVTC